VEKLTKRWCLKARWDGLPLHGLAMLTPAMEYAEISGLYDDIEKNGQRVPVLVWNGLIVDGRHRAIVCDALGLKLKTEDISHVPEEELASLVYSLNASRRHMTSDQRGVVAALMSRESKRGGQPGNVNAAKTNGSNEPFVFGDHCPTGGRCPDGENMPAVLSTRAESARVVGVSRAKVKRAARLLRLDEGLAEQVHSGDMRLSKALKLAEAEEAKKGRVAEPVVQDIENDIYQNGLAHVVEAAADLLADIRRWIKQGLPTVPNERSWNLRLKLLGLINEISQEYGRLKEMASPGELVSDVGEYHKNPRVQGWTGKVERR
jgi:hypothetical protein